MIGIAPFYVLIKTGIDEEIIPCPDLESAKFTVEHLKRYNFKDIELQILKEVKENSKWRSNL